MIMHHELTHSEPLYLEDEYSSLPVLLYSAQSVRDIDRIAIQELGIDGFELMIKAARFSFHALIKQWPDTQNLIILCGSGNNAGDGYIVAALAKKHGLNSHVLFASLPDKLKGDALSAYQMCSDAKVNCQDFDKDVFKMLCEHDNTVILDALLGTGLNGDVKDKYADIIQRVNQQHCPIIAIDIPSGLSANTGQALGISIHADLTATFIGLKVGLFTGSGRQYSGKIAFSDLDLKATDVKHIKPVASRLELKHLLEKLPKRPQDAHKGNCGHTIIMGGDLGYGGAISLAARATARMGSGLTTVVTQPAHRTALLSVIPEAMIFTSQNMSEIELLLKKADVIVIGPGLGQSAWSEKMLLAALGSEKRLVIDADALNLLSGKFSYMLKQSDFRSKGHILTPHPGEAARLLNSTTQNIQSDRVNSAKALQKACGGSILLKGSGSLIFSDKGILSLCPYGNPGMASGGMGDVLSGLIGGLIAQGLTPSYALSLAVCLHAKAADLFASKYGERGLLASDLISVARHLLNQSELS